MPPDIGTKPVFTKPVNTTFEEGSGLSSNEVKAPTLEKPVRITEQVWPEGTVPVVSVFCITYNHAKFIREAIESFLMQETTFPVEIYIHDDSSADGTTEIVQEYAARFPGLIRAAMQRENQYGKTYYKFFFDHLAKQRGEFVAFCEGDDYWICKDKLERQVEQMRRYPKAALCGSRCFVTEEPRRTPYRIEPDTPPTALKEWMSGQDVSMVFFVRFPTRLLRSSVLAEYRRWAEGKDIGTPDWTMLMFCLWKCAAQGCGVSFVEDMLAVYREHSGGAWSGSHNSDRDRRSLIDIKLIKQLFEGLPQQRHLVALEQIYTKRLAHAFDLSGSKRLKYCADALRAEPFNVALWRSFLSAGKQSVFGGEASRAA